MSPVEHCKPIHVRRTLTVRRTHLNATELTKYCAQFAKPERVQGCDEAIECCNCGKIVVVGGDNWQYEADKEGKRIKGEGFCATCGWPARIVHWFANRKNDYSPVNVRVLLQYHPDTVEEQERGY